MGEIKIWWTKKEKMKVENMEEKLKEYEKVEVKGQV